MRAIRFAAAVSVFAAPSLPSVAQQPADKPVAGAPAGVVDEASAAAIAAEGELMATIRTFQGDNPSAVYRNIGGTTAVMSATNRANMKKYHPIIAIINVAQSLGGPTAFTSVPERHSIDERAPKVNGGFAPSSLRIVTAAGRRCRIVVVS